MVRLLAMFRDSGTTTSRTWRRLRHSRVTKFLSSFQWIHIPVSLAFTLIAFQQYRRFKRRQHLNNESQTGALKPIYIASEIEISMYKMLPLRTLSRCWGWINSLELPLIIRSPILQSYAKTFGCNIQEAYIEDLRQYRNLGEFFRRSLKPGLRPIDVSNGVVSPADGTIVHFGRAEDGMVEQVKGINYSLKSFIGPISWRCHEQQVNSSSPQHDYQKGLLLNENDETDLFHCIIYLAPGDYHRFHSPVQWNIEFRRHFPGHLLSVRPTFANWFPRLFNINERVLYVGKWHHGFFSMTAVGATNVGSVSVYFDNKLTTNEKKWKKGTFKDFAIDKQVSLDKGDPFGEFKLGSTIVLVFEAPKNMKFEIKAGQKVKYGQLLSKILDIHEKNQTLGA